MKKRKDRKGGYKDKKKGWKKKYTGRNGELEEMEGSIIKNKV